MKSINNLALLSLSLMPLFSLTMHNSEVNKLFAWNKEPTAIVSSTGNNTQHFTFIEFEDQLWAIMMGSAEHFESLKGNKIKEGEYASKEKLEGSVTTKVIITLARDVFVVADFGYFDKEADGLKKFNELQEQISNANKPF